MRADLTSLPDYDRLVDEAGAMTVVVTGGNRGIGLATARGLSTLGATVILAARDPSGVTDVASEFARRVEFARLDLADPGSITGFASDLSTVDIDVLINNAGMFGGSSREETSAGIERTLAVNFLGTAHLTELLSPRVSRRVVIVSSTAHRDSTATTVEEITDPPSYDPFAAYADSKRAITAWAFRRGAVCGDGLPVVNVVHPGLVRTDLLRPANGGGRDVGRAQAAGRRTQHLLMRMFGQSVNRGGMPLILGALTDLPHDTWLGPTGRRERSGRIALSSPATATLAPGFGDALTVWARRAAGLEP